MGGEGEGARGRCTVRRQGKAKTAVRAKGDGARHGAHSREGGKTGWQRRQGRAGVRIKALVVDQTAGRRGRWGAGPAGERIKW